MTQDPGSKFGEVLAIGLCEERTGDLLTELESNGDKDTEYGVSKDTGSTGVEVHTDASEDTGNDVGRPGPQKCHNDVSATREGDPTLGLLEHFFHLLPFCCMRLGAFQCGQLRSLKHVKGRKSPITRSIDLLYSQAIFLSIVDIIDSIKPR